MTARKAIGTLLVVLLGVMGRAAYGAPGSALDVSAAVGSVSTESIRPGAYAVDGTLSTAWGLLPGSTSGRLEITLQEPALIWGLEISATLPEDTHLDFELRQDGRWISFAGGSLAAVDVTGRFVDLSYDHVVTDRIALVLEGEDADASSVWEVAVRGVEPESSLRRIQPVDLTVSENASFFEPASGLIDGNPRTTWSGSWLGSLPANGALVDALLQALSDEGRVAVANPLLADAEMDLGGVYALEEIRLYVPRATTGTITVSASESGTWTEVGSVGPQASAAWCVLNVQGTDADAVRVSLPVGLWEASLGEVEIWGKGPCPGAKFDDVGYPTMLAQGAPVNYAFAASEDTPGTLEVVLRGSLTESLSLELNGLAYAASAPLATDGLTVYRLELAADALWAGENYVRLLPLGASAEIVAARFRHLELDGSHDVIAGALGDGRLFSPTTISEPGTLAFGQSIVVSSVEVYGAVSGTCELQAMRDGVWEELFAVSVDQDKAVYEVGFVTDQLRIDTLGTEIGEIRVVGSPTTDRPPTVRFIWPDDDVDVPAALALLTQNIIVGFVDNPTAVVTVNGAATAQAGQYFWVTTSALSISTSGPTTVTATAVDGQGRTGQASMLFGGSVELLLSFDETDDTMYSTTTSYTVSGTLNLPFLTVDVGGVAATITGNRFSATVPLGEGLNIVRVTVRQRFTGRYLGSCIKKIVCNTSPIGVQVQEPRDGAYVSSPEATVRGIVTGAGITSVTVGGQAATLTGARFVSQPVALLEGANTITVAAADRFGRTATLNVTVHRDSTSPLVTVTQPTAGQILSSSVVTFGGLATDAGPTWVFVDGRAAERQGDLYTIRLPFLDGARTVDVHATDAAGNRSSTVTIGFTVDTTEPDSLSVTADPAGWTNNTRPVVSFSATDATSGIDHYELAVGDGAYSTVASPYPLPEQEDGAREVHVKAVDRAGWSRVGTVSILIDTVAPPAPEAFRAVPGNGLVILRWVKPSDDTVSYSVSRTPAWGEGTRTLEEVELEDADVTNGSVYSYSIAATDHAANTGVAAQAEATVGVAVANYDPDAGAVVEYENVSLFVPAGSLPEEVKSITITEVHSPEIEAASVYPIMGPIYRFGAVGEVGGQDVDLEGVAFEEPFNALVAYDPDGVLEDFPEQNLGMYYYDTTWSRWFKVPDSVVDEENHTVLFSTTHFTLFSVQPTVVQEPSPQELSDSGYSPFKTKTSHGQVQVSPQSGQVSTEATEFVLPGKAGFDFVLKRTYDAATARSDAAALSVTTAIGKDTIGDIANRMAAGTFDPLAFFDEPDTELSEEEASAAYRYLFGSGDFGYSMGLGWRLNLPSIRATNSSISVSLPSGSTHSVGGMTLVSNDEDGPSARTLTFENHDSADFTLRVTQSRDVVYAETSEGTDEIREYGCWRVTGAELVLKDGSRCTFDGFGQVTEMRDSSGLNPILVAYQAISATNAVERLLDTITDSMGRVITFSYDADYAVPRITGITAPGGSVTYTHEGVDGDAQDRPIPLLKTAADPEGRTWTYGYDTKFLFTVKSEYKVKVGDSVQVGSTDPAVIASLTGGNLRFVKASQEIGWAFPLSSVHGPGTGDVAITNEVKQQVYSQEEGQEVRLLGLIARDKLSLNFTSRIVAASVTQSDYKGHSPALTTTYGYDFTYAQKGQFYNRTATISDTRSVTTIGYNTTTRTSYTLLDGASGSGVFGAKAQASTTVLPYESTRTVADAESRAIETTSTTWYVESMRPQMKKRSRATANYEQTDFSYDNWGNVTYRKTQRKTGDRTAAVEMWAYYYDTESSQDGWPAGYRVNPYGAPDLSREMKDLAAGQMTSISLTTGAQRRQTYYAYSPLGQKSAHSQWVDQAWAETTYGYDPGSGELTKTTDPELHVTDVAYNYDRADQYVVTVTERSVIAADGSTRDIVSSTGYEKATGFKLWEKNPRGYVTSYEYDALGRVERVVRPDDDDQTSWDPTTDPADWREDNPDSAIDYDDAALTATVTGARDQTEVYTYDSLGRLVEVVKRDREYDPSGVVAAGGTTTDVETWIGYDAWGNVSSILDPLKRVTSYEYDALGRTKTVVYPVDEQGKRPRKTMVFDYATNTETITDERQHVTVDTYDMANKLLKRVQTVGGVSIESEWWYDGLGNVVAEEDAEEWKTTREYNELGLEVKRTLPSETYYEDGAMVAYSPVLETDYDSAGHRSSETLVLHAGSQVVSYTDDGLGRIITTSRTYTDYRETTPTTRTAVEWAFYDDNGNKTKVVDARNIARAQEERKSKTYEYSARDKLVAEVDELLNRTVYGYDDDDNQTLVSDPREAVTAYTGDFTMERYYDDLGRLIVAKLPKGAGQAVKQVVSLAYDARGNLDTRTEADGGTTKYLYTSRDKVLSETRTGVDSGGATVTMTITHDYDDAANETSVTDGKLQVTTKDYDELNRIVLVTYPEGNTERYSYDRVGNLRTVTNGNSHTTTYTYDSQRRVIGTEDADAKTTTTRYTGRGDKSYHKDAKGNVTTWLYDERGLLVKETNALGLVRTYAYDEAGYLVKSTDPRETVVVTHYTENYLPDVVTRTNGAVTETTVSSYDEGGALKEVTKGGVRVQYNTEAGAYVPDPYGMVQTLGRRIGGQDYTVRYGYDVMNRVVSVSAPDGSTVPYEYDTLGRLEKVPGYVLGSISYDGNGRLAGYTAGNGMVVSADHDRNGRLTWLGYQGTTEPLTSFDLDYDGASNVVTKNGSSYAYDELERLVYAHQEGRFAVQPEDTIQDVGLLAEDFGEEGVLEFDGGEVELKLDYAGMSVGADLGGVYEVVKLEVRPQTALHRVSGDNLSVSTATQNWQGQYEKQEDWSFAVDSDGLMTVLFRQPVRARYVKLHCYYDDRGAEYEAVDAATVLNQREKLLVVYYNASVRTESYGYDEKGNRTWMGLEVGNTTRNVSYSYYASSDRLKSEGTWGYVYDENGNLVEKGKSYTESGEVVTFSQTEGEYWGYRYDLEDRLVEVKHGAAGKSSAAVVVSYTYDPLGLKVKTNSVKRGASVTVYGVDGSLVYEKTPAVERSYVYAFGRHLGKREKPLGATTTETTYYVTDHLGSTVIETDESGRVVWSSDYTAFGESAHESGTDEEAGKYTGKELDPETGLYYFNARWYEPQTGRFITEDPARDGQAWYVYCYNNPLRYRDPRGLRAEEEVGDGRTYDPQRDLYYDADGSVSSNQGEPMLRLDPGEVERAGLMGAYMDRWNALHRYTSESFLPGSTRTDWFGKQQGPYDVSTPADVAAGQTTWYQTTHHAGVDRVTSAADQSTVAPVYLRVVERLDDRVTMNVIGTDRNVSVMHLNPADVAAIAVGQVFPPGSEIAPYPGESFGTGTGAHVHIQESDLVNGVRTIVDPDTHRVVADQVYQKQFGVSAGEASPVAWGNLQSIDAY